MGDLSQSSPSRGSRLRILVESALQDYRNKTGVTLTSHQLAEQLQNCNSIESVTYVLQVEARAFREFGGDSQIMNLLKGIVSVLYTVSAGTALGLPITPAKAIFAGFAILLAEVKDVSTSYDALVNLLESIEQFISHLLIYTRVPSTGAMAETIIKIMVELISTIALVTKQVIQKRPIKLVKKLLGEVEVEAVLQRLDRLTLDEALTTAVQILEVVYSLVQNMRVVVDGGNASIDSVWDTLEVIQRLANDANKSKRDKLHGDMQIWLSPPDPWKNHNLACGSRHPGTSKWFLQSDALLEWKSSGPSSLLWVHGKPGAGKSVLCSSIIEDIDSMRKSGLASLVFFYCDFREDQKKEYRGLVSSLLIQLCHQSDTYSNALSNFYLEHNNGSKDPSDDALVKCLTEVLKLPGQTPIYMIIDALDECPLTSSLPSPRDRVLKLVEELIDSHIPHLHVCITSRPEMDIKAILAPLIFRSISLHDEIGQMKDIEDYIKSVVNADRIMRRWNAAEKQLIIDVLTKKADGMFRWVYCQLLYLRRCLPGRIRHALDELPETLDETYERALRDIDEANWELAHRLLEFVAVASRPLRVEELAQFLGFDFEAGPIPKFHHGWLLEDPIDAVLSTTSSLLAIVDVNGSPVIQFSHFSIKEFLTSSRLAEASDVILRRYHISMLHAHTFAAQACLGMLLHLDKSITPDHLKKFPLAEYAAEHCVDHARFEDVSWKVEDGIKQLFEPGKYHFATWVWIYDLEDRSWNLDKRRRGLSQPRGTPLHYAALCGLDTIVKFLATERAQDVNSRGFDHKSTPLHLASGKGHVGVACLLLDHGADAEALDGAKSTPLHLASKWGHAEVVRVLLKRGVDATPEDEERLTPWKLAFRGGHHEVTKVFFEFGAGEMAEGTIQRTPLNRALFEGNIGLIHSLLDRGTEMTGQADAALGAALLGGHAEVIRVLLEHGVDATAWSHDGWSLLHSASAGGHADVVRILLEHGVDATAFNKDGSTPIHGASFAGHTEVVRIFLEHGVDATVRNEDGSTSLHGASYAGQVEVVRTFLEHGVDAKVRTKCGWTALHLAALTGHAEVARLLLEHGADAKDQANDGWTPLHAAAVKGHEELAHLLLESGADATAQVNDGRSPFQVAADEGHVGLARLLEHRLNATVEADDRQTPFPDAEDEGQVEPVCPPEHVVGVMAHADGGQPRVHVSATEGDVELVPRLPEREVDATDDVDDDHSLPRVAADEAHAELVRRVLEHERDATAEADYGRTPLNVVADEAHAELSRPLLEHEPGVTAEVADGQHPLDMVSRSENQQPARVLVDYDTPTTTQNDQRCCYCIAQ